MTPFTSWLVVLIVFLVALAVVAVWDYLVPSRIVAWLHRTGVLKSEAEFEAQSQAMAKVEQQRRLEVRERLIHDAARSIVDPERRRLHAVMTPAKLVNIDLHRRAR